MELNLCSKTPLKSEEDKGKEVSSSFSFSYFDLDCVTRRRFLLLPHDPTLLFLFPPVCDERLARLDSISCLRSHRIKKLLCTLEFCAFATINNLVLTLIYLFLNGRFFFLLSAWVCGWKVSRNDGVLNGTRYKIRVFGCFGSGRTFLRCHPYHLRIPHPIPE